MAVVLHGRDRFRFGRRDVGRLIFWGVSRWRGPRRLCRLCRLCRRESFTRRHDLSLPDGPLPTLWVDVSDTGKEWWSRYRYRYRCIGSVGRCCGRRILRLATERTNFRKRLSLYVYRIFMYKYATRGFVVLYYVSEGWGGTRKHHARQMHSSSSTLKTWAIFWVTAGPADPMEVCMYVYTIRTLFDLYR